MNRQEAVDQVEQGLTFLILNHAHCTASEQYAPCHTADESDEYIREHRAFVTKLRDIRQAFENAITGIILEIPYNEKHTQSID